MKNTMERQILRSNRERVGITSDKEFAKQLGFSYSTYVHQRKQNPASFILYELRAIIRLTNMPDEDILALVKGEG